MGREVKIESTDRTRKIGKVQGNVFISPRTEKDHLFRGGLKTNAEAKREHTACWGMDAKVCDQLIAEGVEWLIIDTGSLYYKCRLTEMKAMGRVLNLGHGVQYFLNLDIFEKIKPKGGEILG